MSSSCPVNGALSCHNTTVQDTCCFNAPGGLLLQTQFFDINPPTGPVDSWTLHGLWPDNCDGTYEANCDGNRVFHNISAILSSSSRGSETLQFMNTYWKDYQGDDETFWEHEWSKHGTCISTLDPDCFGVSSTRETDGVEAYFTRAVTLFRSLPTYDWLSEAGILPSNTQTYAKSSILAALKAKTGYEPYLGCQSGVLNEVWYFYNVEGSLLDGTFQHAAIVGKTGTCGSVIQYLPKSSAPTTTTTSSGPQPTGSPFSGKGHLVVQQGGCLISAGTWYKSGTCATFTANQSKEGTFTLASSKGPCGIQDSALVCGSGVKSSYLFAEVDGTLGQFGFSTDSTIAGSQQATIYEGTEHPVVLQISWGST